MLIFYFHSFHFCIHSFHFCIHYFSIYLQIDNGILILKRFKLFYNEFCVFNKMLLTIIRVKSFLLTLRLKQTNLPTIINYHVVLMLANQGKCEVLLRGQNTTVAIK